MNKYPIIPYDASDKERRIYEFLNEKLVFSVNVKEILEEENKFEVRSEQLQKLLG